MILALLACTQTVRFPAPAVFLSDTGFDTNIEGTPTPTPTPDTEILSSVNESTLVWGCNLDNSAINATFETDGWAGGATALLVDNANDQAELHPLYKEDSDVSGRWDQYTLGPLAHGATTAVAGESTAFVCGETDSRASWVIWTVDRDAVPADCVVWGPDRGGALAVLHSLEPQVAPLCRDLGSSPS